MLVVDVSHACELVILVALDCLCANLACRTVRVRCVINLSAGRPGSHKSGLARPAEWGSKPEQNPPLQAIPADAGDAIVFTEVSSIRLVATKAVCPFLDSDANSGCFART